MRRFFTRLITLSILLHVVGASVVFAAPAAQGRYETLESLSVYFPKDTILYAATRIDERFVTALDGLAETVMNQLPPALLPQGLPANLTAALDLVAAQAVGGSFDKTLRPWLGDTMAVGIYPALRSPGGRVAIQITDAKAALDATLKALPDWTSRAENGYTLVTPIRSDDHNRIAIYPNVMLLYSWSDETNLQQVPILSPNVTANTYYNTALSRLPEANYDMLAFVDTPLMLAYNQRSGYQDEGEWIISAAVYRMIGSTAFGGHVGNDQTLTLDMVQTAGNTVGLDSLDVHFTGQGAVLKPDILQNIPRNAFLVMQGADAASMLDFVGSSAQAAAKKFQAVLPNIITGLAYSSSYSTAGLVSGGFTSVTNSEWANVFFANLSGYDYTSEIRPLLSENSSLFLSLNPLYNPTSAIYVNREPFDGALVFEVSDPEAAQHFITKLSRELAISLYSSGDHFAARIQEVTLAGGVQGVSLTIYGETGQPFDQFIAGSHDNLLVVGSARAVNQVISGDGLGFNGTAGDLLPNAGAALYLNVPPPQSPEWTKFTQSDPGNPVLQLLPYVAQQLTVSAAGTENNDLLLRLTVALPCGENCG